MVVSTLIGGLGNQMFQYAAGRALALRNGTRLVLDSGWLESPPTHLTPRRYELDCFRIEAEVRSIYPPTPTLRVAEVLRLAPRVWREQMFRFDPRTLELRGHVRLIGYWSSEKYFADQAETIRRDFEFRSPLPGRNRELADVIRSTASVAVHVRRGDYLKAATRAFHGVLSPAYYEQAATVIAERVSDPLFLLFSDDPAWCRANIHLPAPTIHVDHNRGRGVDDLRLMRMCAHQIIANSSFSWWGAWLNPRPDKVVIAPRSWIADPSLDTDHVVPDGWVRL